MMRWLAVLLAALVFVAFWLFDTVALVRLGATCVTGHCGVSVRTLLLITAAVAMVLLVRYGWRRLQHMRAAHRPKRRKGRATSGRVPKSRR